MNTRVQCSEYVKQNEKNKAYINLTAIGTSEFKKQPRDRVFHFKFHVPHLWESYYRF